MDKLPSKADSCITRTTFSPVRALPFVSHFMMEEISH
jgi:hypothetical protein